MGHRPFGQRSGGLLCLVGVVRVDHKRLVGGDGVGTSPVDVVLAAGTFHGKVVIIDFNKPSGQEVIAMSEFNSMAHSEPVMEVQWRTELNHGKKPSYTIFSVGGDGRAIKWSIPTSYTSSGQSSLGLVGRYLVSASDLRRSQRLSTNRRIGKTTEVGCELQCTLCSVLVKCTVASVSREPEACCGDGSDVGCLLKRRQGPVHCDHRDRGCTRLLTTARISDRGGSRCWGDVTGGVGTHTSHWTSVHCLLIPFPP